MVPNLVPCVSQPQAETPTLVSKSSRHTSGFPPVLLLVLRLLVSGQVMTRLHRATGLSSITTIQKRVLLGQGRLPEGNDMGAEECLTRSHLEMETGTLAKTSIRSKLVASVSVHDCSRGQALVHF